MKCLNALAVLSALVGPIVAQAAATGSDVPGAVATASGAPARADAKVEANIRASFSKSYPSVLIKGVFESPWPGMYEAVTPEGIFYADASGRYAIHGKLIEVPTQTDLTSQREAEIGRIDFSTLPLARAIKRVKGSGRRVMAVFADPDCPYCKRLESDLKSVDDLTVYYFLYPIDSLHPEASKRARQIWCSGDPAKAWVDWVADGTAPPDASCKGDPVDELARLAGRLEVIGTPTIFLPDGHRIAGYVPRDDLERALDATALPASVPGT